MTQSPSPVQRRAVLMLLLATLYWGVSFPVIKAVSDLNGGMFPGCGTWFIASQALAPRFALATVILVVVSGGALARMRRLEVQQGAVMGLFATGGALFQTDGLQYTLASTSAFLTQFSAILIPVWIALRHRRNPGAAVWLGCVLVLVGVAILGRFDLRSFRLGRGEWETLLSSVFFMGQILCLEKPEFSGNRPGQVTLAMFAMQTACFTALAAATAPRLPDLLVPWTSSGWLGLTLILAVVCTIGAFTLMNRWQPHITATQAGLIYCVEPLFAAVLALFVPEMLSSWTGVEYRNEHLSWSLVIGGGLVTVANVIVLTRNDRAQESAIDQSSL